jgi:hypothetical protein
MGSNTFHTALGVHFPARILPILRAGLTQIGERYAYGSKLMPLGGIFVPREGAGPPPATRQERLAEGAAGGKEE